MAFMVLPIYSRGNVAEFQFRFGNFSLKDTKNIIFQTAKALEYLHKLSIVHRDVKLENLLLVDDLLNVKLCDFGFAIFQNEAIINVQKVVGTPEYIAPEILISQKKWLNSCYYNAESQEEFKESWDGLVHWINNVAVFTGNHVKNTLRKFVDRQSTSNIHEKIAQAWSKEYVNFFTLADSRGVSEFFQTKGNKKQRKVTKRTSLRQTALSELLRLNHRQYIREGRNKYASTTVPRNENIEGVSNFITPHANNILWFELQQIDSECIF
eukprot:Pgem_evm1s8233